MNISNSVTSPSSLNEEVITPDQSQTDTAVEVSWSEREMVDDARIGAMYCFKNCDKNKN